MPHGRWTKQSTTVRVIYHRLFRAFGPQGWWPARSPFEVMVGAILTQATRWHNVEEAIRRLRRAGGMHPQRLAAMRAARVGCLIRPAGYFRQKARRLKAFSGWYLRRYGGESRRMFRTPWPMLREELLEQEGIGPETADAILLYAGAQPAFVVDAYTRRIFRRHRLIGSQANDRAIQRQAMQALPEGQVQALNEFHALLVAAGKRFCHRHRPACEQCPLGELPHTVR